MRHGASLGKGPEMALLCHADANRGRLETLLKADLERELLLDLFEQSLAQPLCGLPTRGTGRVCRPWRRATVNPPRRDFPRLKPHTSTLAKLPDPPVGL